MEIFRSLLFVPAISDRMVAAAGRTAADAIVLDLEDAVPAGEKQLAREGAARAIASLRGPARGVFVRVNDVRSGLTRDDLLAVVGPALAGVVAPKVESAQDLRDLDVLIREAELANGVRPGDIVTIPIIESARGVLRCEEIARASDRVAALSVGGEDYTTDIGVARTADGAALAHIRAVVVQVAVAYEMQPIDTPWPAYKDAAGLRKETSIARATGMKGKYAIHPDQVDVLNRAFSPTAGEAAAARRIVAAYDAAIARGEGAIAVDGRMVDAPIAARARAVLARSPRSSAVRKRIASR